MLTYLKHMALAAAAALCAAPAAQAADQPQEWELINPTGEIEKVAVEPAKRITALEGKTIAKDFPDQRAARDVMRETAAMPYKFYSQETCVPGKDFGPYDENTFIPRSRRPSPSSSSSRAGRASSPRSGYPSRRCSSPFPRR